MTRPDDAGRTLLPRDRPARLRAGLLAPALAALLAVLAPAPLRAQSPGADSVATAPGVASAHPHGGAMSGDSLAGVATSELEGRPIRTIRVRSQNVFDPLPEGPLRFVGRLANRVHVRTRSSVIREQLLLSPGEPWSEARAQESMRLLRGLRFLEPVRIAALPSGDSVDVEVETRDVWTTRPEFDLERGGGKQFGQFAFTELNLAGFGKSVSLAYRDDPVGITRSIGVEDPGIAGSRLVLRANGARGTSGASDRVEVLLPFYALDSRWSFGLSAIRRSGTAHLFQDNAEVATLGEQVEETRAFVGRGWRHGGQIRRLVLNLRSLDRRLDPTQPVSGVSVPESFLGPEEFLRLRELLLEGRIWKPRYIERRGIDRVDQVEDFDLGPSLAVALGVAPRAFGSSAGYGVFRGRLDFGVATPVGFGVFGSAISGRWRKSAEEVLHVTSGRWILQTHPTHTLEGAVLGIGGFRMPRNYQTVIGGLNGLRAYPVHAVAGARVLRWNVEDRHMLVRDIFEFVSIGSAVFVDGARGWGPGAEGVDWFHCAGVGVRFAPPRAAIGPVFRADLAWPISPTRDGRRDAVLSIGSSQAF